MRNKVLYKLNIEFFLCENQENKNINVSKEINVINIT